MFALKDFQIEAVKKMKNGCILNGGVGSGKSLTSLGYYYLRNGGKMSFLQGKGHSKMKNPKDLYIITTARKRDTKEWEEECAKYLIGTDIYSHKLTIDSWNNIRKYKEVKDAFFIFDEQRVVGNGAWVKAFLKIAKKNKWILLSATPGDTWSDYIPVFIANGFYKNRTQFLNEHAVFSRFSKFPKIEKFIGTRKLERLRSSILVDMEFKRQTVRHYENVLVDYDHILYKRITKDRWDFYNDVPIENPGALCYLQRKVCNSDESRAEAVLNIYKKHDRIIIFYNFNYELEILKNIKYGKNVVVAEWNGQAHEPVPDSKKWVYLVQYTAGCEGWNCITTNAMIFYSQNYSYKVMEQASGRIDRLNTPYKDLYYYILKSRATIDLAVARAIKEKKNFNERKYTKWDKNA